MFEGISVTLSSIVSVGSKPFDPSSSIEIGSFSFFFLKKSSFHYSLCAIFRNTRFVTAMCFPNKALIFGWLFARISPKVLLRAHFSSRTRIFPWPCAHFTVLARKIVKIFDAHCFCRAMESPRIFVRAQHAWFANDEIKAKRYLWNESDNSFLYLSTCSDNARYSSAKRTLPIQIGGDSSCHTQQKGKGVEKAGTTTLPNRFTTFGSS